jgi:hypothetical protein
VIICEIRAKPFRANLCTPWETFFSSSYIYTTQSTTSKLSVSFSERLHFCAIHLPHPTVCPKPKKAFNLICANQRVNLYLRKSAEKIPVIICEIRGKPFRADLCTPWETFTDTKTHSSQKLPFAINNFLISSSINPSLTPGSFSKTSG